MNKLALAVIFILLSAPNICSGNGDTCRTTEEAVKYPPYSRGVSYLNKVIKSAEPHSEKRLCALKTLGEFHENKSGDFEKALLLYKKISQEKLFSGHPIKESAKKKELEIGLLKSKYSNLDRKLLKIKIDSNRPEPISETKEVIKRLKALIADSDDYYRKFELIYYLGVNYLKLEKNFRALKAFDKALELKPALDFYLPATINRDRAFSEFKRGFTHQAARGVLSIVLMVSMLLFYRSKPWQWIGYKHIAALLIIMALWFAVFHAAFKWFGSHSDAAGTLKQDANTVLPVFIHSAPADPGGAIGKSLSIYGAAGIISLFVFSIGTGRVKSRVTAFLANYLFAWVVFIAVSAMFYMEVCDGEGFYEAKQGSVANHIYGNIYFELKDPEPLILTNPKAYPELKADNIDEPELRKWVIRNCVK